MAQVLLVENEQELVLSLLRVLKSQEIKAKFSAVTSANKAIELVQKSPPEVIILDLCLDESIGVESGFSVLKQVQEIDTSIRVIVLTGHGNSEYGIRSLSLGAASFLEKPAEISQLKALIEDGIYQAKLRREFLKQKKIVQDKTISQFIGNSTLISKIKEDIVFAAANDQPVLILGETGTGKGLCAKLIHELSRRKTQELVSYQPSSVGHDLVNSELFGHKAGSFTGADFDRQGLIARANKGSLFLDEVDNLPLNTQVLLLTVLQDKSFRSVGDDEVKLSDFRLITASNAEIENKITSKEFRLDLYHRISQIVIFLPPLKERIDDIPYLVDFFLNKLYQEKGLKVLSCDKNVMNYLKTLLWPGNVRQLEAVVTNAAFRAAYDCREIVL
ncbi:MAG: sigma-54-dependent Fis family transcriptional regulator [Bdellovibrionales bacterium]|nr:sigma-54-dependent Fis family transcriptional regulator [Bdellovibrionales bacterium]